MALLVKKVPDTCASGSLRPLMARRPLEKSLARCLRTHLLFEIQSLTASSAARASILISGSRTRAFWISDRRWFIFGRCVALMMHNVGCNRRSKNNLNNAPFWLTAAICEMIFQRKTYWILFTAFMSAWEMENANACDWNGAEYILGDPLSLQNNASMAKRRLNISSIYTNSLCSRVPGFWLPIFPFQIQCFLPLIEDPGRSSQDPFPR